MNGNPPQRVAPTGGKRLSRRTLILVILGVALLVLGFGEFWGISAICPKCLQGACIAMVKVAGIPVFKWTTYSQHIPLSPSWSGRTVSVPGDIHPRMYTEILGKKCSHELKRDGFGASSFGFLLWGMHKDGAFSQRRLYQPRIEAVAALYSAFKNVPSESLARMTYARIDSALPMNDEKRLQEVHQIQKMRESGAISDQEIKEFQPAAFRMYRAIEEIKAFTVRLSDVTSEEEWVSLLHDLDQRLYKEAQTE